jgi:hypothetical protein
VLPVGNNVYSMDSMRKCLFATRQNPSDPRAFYFQRSSGAQIRTDYCALTIRRVNNAFRSLRASVPGKQCSDLSFYDGQCTRGMNVKIWGKVQQRAPMTVAMGKAATDLMGSISLSLRRSTSTDVSLDF